MLLPKTNLLTGDSASSKLDPARTLGVAVQDKAQFRKWLVAFHRQKLRRKAVCSDVGFGW